MDRAMFDSSSNEDKICYINDRLANGETVIRIREDLGIGEKALQKIVKESGYKYNQKLKRYDKGMINTLENKEYAKDNTNIIPFNLKDDILEIVQMKEDLKEIINKYKNGYVKEHTPQVIEIVEGTCIRINLPDAEIVRSTFRVNKEILDRWNLFCEDNKEFSKTNLLSSALEEYIEKYSK